MARPRLEERVAAQRVQREALDRRRVRRSVTRRDGVGVEVDGRWLLDFCGNDYLGLAQHFAVVDALQDAAARHGTGGIASHLVCGHHALHDALERHGHPRSSLAERARAGVAVFLLYDAFGSEFREGYLESLRDAGVQVAAWSVVRPSVPRLYWAQIEKLKAHLFELCRKFSRFVLRQKNC